MKATLYHRSQHLDATQLIEATAACPACGDDSPRRPVGCVQDHPIVRLLRCARCGGCSVSHMPRPAVLDAYYRDYYPQQDARITFAAIDRFARHLLRSMRPVQLPHHTRLLDFGGGDATLALALARQLIARHPDRRVTITLVDYQSPRPSADPRITCEHHARLEQVHGHHDLVIASAILEHIPDLRQTLDQLFGCLAPGGWFYARTPYVVPLKRLLPALDITFPAHVHDLGPAFWNRLPRTFALPLRIVASRPSIIESSLRTQPRRTIAAWLMKLPARAEMMLLRRPHTPLWRLVGGWEVVLQRLDEPVPAIDPPRP